jgi:hypothetical protein
MARKKKTFEDVFDPLKRMRSSEGRACDHPGCEKPAEHRAPKSPDDLGSFYWFCLDHVQAYNRAWNFYAGMTAEEIEKQIQFDTIWNRPTWPLGSNPRFDQLLREGNGGDPFRLFEEERAGAHSRQMPDEEPDGPLTLETRALRTMGLSRPVTADQLKARFKELVKKLHPDSNGGDKAAEERLRLVIEAYAILRTTARQPGKRAAV